MPTAIAIHVIKVVGIIAGRVRFYDERYRLLLSYQKKTKRAKVAMGKAFTILTSACIKSRLSNSNSYPGGVFSYF